MHTWQMQDAKARLSELVKRAESEGPQEITLHGKSIAVLMSRATYARLTGKDDSLVDFIRESPLYGIDELELERDQSPTREVTL